MSHLKWTEVKMMDIRKKFYRGMANLKRSVEYTYSGEVPSTEEEFTKIKWLQDNGEYTTTNPHSELTWDKVKAEMDAVQSKYDSQDYARKRQAEYPTIEELVVALYDTDDKAAIEAKRAEVKAKYPK